MRVIPVFTVSHFAKCFCYSLFFCLIPFASFCQTPSIFNINQKTFIETHQEFPYHDPEAAKKDSVKTFTSCVYRFSEKGIDTLETLHMVFDKEGRIIQEVENPLPGDKYGSGEHITTYYYDEKGNDTLVRKAIRSPSYQWLMYLEYEAALTGSEEKKMLLDMKNKLKAEGLDTISLRTQDERVFVYDSKGYPVYFTNRGVGYKCVISYKLDAKGLVEEIFSVDTNQSLYSRVNQYSWFSYDNKNRIVRVVKKGEPAKENTLDRPWESITEYEYDTSGRYSRIIVSDVKKGQVRNRDTTNYYYIYNAKKELVKEITAKGTDTMTVVTRTYENGLEKMMISEFHQTEHSFAPGNRSKETYTYYDDGKLKTTTYYSMISPEAEEGDPEADWMEKFESYYYTYH